MKNGNGKPIGAVGEFLETVHQGRAQAVEQCLVDMVDKWPLVRKVLTGSPEGEGVLLPGGMRIVVQPPDVLVQLSRPQFHVEMRHEGKNLFECLDALENDLECTGGNWRPDWQARKRERSRHSL